MFNNFYNVKILFPKNLTWEEDSKKTPNSARKNVSTCVNLIFERKLDIMLFHRVITWKVEKFKLLFTIFKIIMILYVALFNMKVMDDKFILMIVYY